MTPGQEIKFEKPLDLSAILHVEKLPDGRLKFTTISLLYGSYGPTSNGPVLFSLAPPAQLHVENGLPVLSTKDLAAAEEQYAAYRAKMGFSNQSSSQQAAEPDSDFILQIISNKSITPIKKALPKNIPRVGKTVPATTPTAKPASPAAPNVARALPLNTPAVLPATPVTLPTAPAIPVAKPLPTPPLAKPVAKALPATPATPVNASLPAGPTPAAVPSTAEATPDLAAANQSVLPAPTSFTSTPSTTPAESWPTYDSGKMPRGRFVAPTQFSDLAAQGLAGERLYLQGDFAVTASGQDRSVLRYQASATPTLTPDRIAKTRIIVAYPPQTAPPAEGTTISRNQDRPFMITDVKKGNDGTVNVYVREITK